ncbi:MAG TPA: SDR family NAD(P)-dependent oxidoreductase [Candidatus Angelobacter sp.]|nr:SDR family NAD(P)-dependent oxidoreductase [Candidatus Angelobacter sp.]
MPKTTSPARVAVITGGSRGIGLALARAFSQAGYSVVITGRDQKRLQAAAKHLRGSLVLGIQCDVRDASSVMKLFARIKRQYSAIDVLVNNAGIAHALAPVEKLPVEAWREVIDTNLTGTFLVTQAALPLMHAGGSIVNNLSVAAVQPFAGMAAYNASKFGALGFTQALREDLRKRGIRVLALLPGATDTEIWNQFWPDAPKEKMISPETVAAAVLHAVSAPPDASIDEIRIGPTAGVL